MASWTTSFHEGQAWRDLTLRFSSLYFAFCRVQPALSCVVHVTTSRIITTVALSYLQYQSQQGFYLLCFRSDTILVHNLATCLLVCGFFHTTLSRAPSSTPLGLVL
jgi:hypothetical protein